MTRSEWKAAARAQLGGGIFKDQWLMGVVFCLVVSAIVGAAGSILPGVGALVVTGPMLYAQKYAFLAQAREGRGIDLNDLFRGFRDDFGGTLLISLLSGLFIFLWSLLLFIPGIVKAYAYSMVYYVKADHPRIRLEGMSGREPAPDDRSQVGEVRARSELYRLGHRRLAVPWRRHAVGHDLHGGDRSAIL